MVEVTMTGAMATVSLTGTPCRCSSPELAATHPAAAGRPIAGLTQGARMLGVGGRVELQFSPRNYLNLQRGQRQDRKLQEKVVSVQNVAGLWRRTAGSARAVVRAMAEDSSSESSVTTEERALSPEEEEDQANVSEILRVYLRLTIDKISRSSCSIALSL